MNTGQISIRKGKIIYGKMLLKEIIRKLTDGTYGFEFRPWAGFKTTLQIRAFHGPVLKAYCAYTGMTKQEAKRHLKIEYGQCYYFTRNGVNYVELKSLADYSKTEMREFMQAVIDHLEFDCQIILDFQTRSTLLIDESTGELTPL